MKNTFNITGMTCSACSAHVDKSVSKLEGVQYVNVNLLQNKMIVEYNESLVSDNDIIGAVVKGGYGASLASKTQSKSTEQNPKSNIDEEAKQMQTRIIVSFVFFIPLLYIAMAHMAEMGLPAILLGHENMLIFGLVQLILTLPIAYVNRKYFFNGFKTLFRGSPNMDSLIAIGSAAAIIYSIYALFNMAFYVGHGDFKTAHDFVMELYFESAGTILTLVTFGKYLESRSKKRTSDAITKLINLVPKTAIVLKNGIETEVQVSDLVVGDVIVVKAGQGIPADGIIIEGNGIIDESVITGESIPVMKNPGDSVIGATINKSGYFKLEAKKVGEDTTLSQIIALVEEAGSSKAPIAKLADKVSGVFVPIVIVIALLTSIVWLLMGYPFSFALSTGIAVLVISCPCALGLATPTAIMVGTGKGAEYGILIKSAESLEIAHKIDTVVLDKTGTITKGKPQVTDVFVSDELDEMSLIQIAATIENQSEHPLAEAIVEYAQTLQLPINEFEVTEFGAIEGQGIFANINGSKILAGNLRMLREHKVALHEFNYKGSSAIEKSDITHVEALAEDLANSGKTPLFFAQNSKLIGVIAVADVIKESTPQAIEGLKKLGIDVIMLTGDNQLTAKAIAEKVGITNIIAEVLPQDKEAQIRKLQSEGRKTAMIGDGINDAPALARADVGIAIGAGTDIAIESADIVLMKSDLMDSVTAIQLSKAVIKNIKQNLFWAFIYNIIGIPIAAGLLFVPFGIKLSPMIGAATMSVSSVFVVSNALRLKLFKAAKKKGQDIMLTSEEGHDDSKMKFEEIQDKSKINNELNNEINNEIKEIETMKKEIKIEGMMCGHCKAAVEKALNGVEGVVSAEVKLEDKAAFVELSKEISDDKFKSVIQDAGYEVIAIQ